MKKALVFGLSSNLGGVETVFDSFYNHFDKREYCFDFVARDNNIAYQEKYKHDGCIVYDVPSFTKRPLRYYYTIKKIILSGKYDMVYINLLSAANVLPIIAAKNAGVKHIILHAHNSGTVGTMRKLLHFFGKRYLRRQNVIKIACSNKAGHFIYGDSRYILINNPFHHELFRYNEEYRNEIRAHYGIQDDCKLIGAVGRLTLQKNPLFIIEVLKRVHAKNVKLMLIGDGELKDKILKKIESSGLSDKIIVINSKKDVYKYYSAFDLFVMPSKFEALGMVGLEAQASGLCCLFSDSVPRIIDVGRCKFLPLSYDVWANEIDEESHCSHERNLINSFDFEERFGAKSNSEKLISIFDEGAA